ncbi:MULTISPECIES: response regulator [Flavobacteriaceae]|uniref:Response regulator transcription factor n=2 Tax=Flavobacteriaceae TaxID=49546 RepID=A0ABN1JYH1_9FLAO|nr:MULTISPECIES: response regulator transcription factor [Meridianimaribacter]RYH73104.1 response regulator transcription factor [Flavobacteriaceae bacterium 144Ye]TBV24987.1 DNA-binding response regulator [Meridianimaribacter sp. CL38]TDY10156.1 LuxR family two component transcriptional regulator [Meridianimaribacter flavus]
MIKVLVVDNHPIIRTGLKLLFEHSHEIDVIGGVGSGIEIFEFVRRYPVDVIISEIDLPELNGITALRAIKKEHQNLKVIMYSHHPEEIYAISVLKAGASAYVSKTVDTDTLKEAILKVHQGDIYLSNNMAKHLTFDEAKKTTSRLYKRLSTREVEVLKLLSSGKKNKEIAMELDINEKTVSTYKARLFKKLKVTNLVDLIHQAKHLELT